MYKCMYVCTSLYTWGCTSCRMCCVHRPSGAHVYMCTCSGMHRGRYRIPTGIRTYIHTNRYTYTKRTYAHIHVQYVLYVEINISSVGYLCGCVCECVHINTHINTLYTHTHTHTHKWTRSNYAVKVPSHHIPHPFISSRDKVMNTVANITMKMISYTHSGNPLNIN